MANLATIQQLSGLSSPVAVIALKVEMSIAEVREILDQLEQKT